eukprot:scaffold925_cov129-Cylindrotheca_fusiformis.AAC.41
MAAVICKGIGEICMLPCRLCSSLCQGCGTLCSSTCQACSSVCCSACEGCGHMCQTLCNNPFCMLVTVAIITQVPAFFLFIPEVEGLPDCDESVWLLVNAVLAIINVATPFYLAYRIADVDNNEMAHMDNAFKRASYLAWGAALSVKDTDEDVCSDTVDRMVVVGFCLGWAFVFLGFFALVFSMCCARFDTKDYAARPDSADSNEKKDVEKANA